MRVAFESSSPPGTEVELGFVKRLGGGLTREAYALYLAEHGWRVTGFDISTEALRLVRHQARERGLEIEIEHANGWRYEFGVERWDLIVCSYVMRPTIGRADEITRSLAPGGVLVVEGFLRSEELAAQGRPKLGFEPGALRAAYTGLEMLRYEEVSASADWAPGEILPLARLVARKPRAE